MQLNFMLDFARELHDELVLKLETQHKTRIRKAFSLDHSLRLVLAAIDQLKERLRTHQFSNEEEEICFFKTTLPSLLSLFYYYTERFDLESVQQVGSAKSGEEYFEQQTRKMDEFFKTHTEFLKYYRSGRTDLDKYYFLRNSPLNQGNMDLMTTMMDPSFCTLYSIKVATILAYSDLEDDIRRIQIDKKNEVQSPVINNTRLKWTDSKQGLIELIYSLHVQQSFNNGNVDLKEITACFEDIFSVPLGNVSSGFQKILSRKTGYTNFIDKLREKLKVRIDEIEDKHIK